MSTFALYVRVSQVNGREGESFSSPEDQEAAARAWCDREGVEPYFEEDECVDLDVSGALAVADRKLGRLIERCESGEFEGIVVRYESRFARDTIAGGTALRRLADCGARLIATATGFDSKNLNPESNMVFNILMSVGQAERERNRGNYMGGKLKAARRGEWCSQPPFGYDRVDKRLVPNKEQAKVVLEIFRRRAEGESFSKLSRSLRSSGLSRSGIRRVVMNRSYLGEQHIPDPNRKGEVIVLEENQPPLITERQFEAANAVKGNAPQHTGHASKTMLSGVVRCGLCGSKMHPITYGPERDKLTYACTARATHDHPKCGKASMTVALVEPAVLDMLSIAIGNRAPHVAAVIEGDNRYNDALRDIEDAQSDLAEYRDSIDIQRELGARDYAAGLKTRKEAVETARRALRGLPRPEPTDGRLMTLEEFGLLDQRRFYAKCIAEVRVFPRSAEHRLTLRWHGTEEHIPVPALPALTAAQKLGIAQGVPLLPTP